MTRGHWMGCWNLIINKAQLPDALSVKELKLLSSLSSLGPSIGSGQFSTLNYYSKPCIYRAVGSWSRLLLLPGKEPDYYCFRLLSTLRAGYCRLGASFWLLPAGSGTFMSTDYSCGLFGMHNVEGQNTQALPGYLDLSNTWFPRKTLSLSKPPRLFYQKVTF